MEISNKKKSVPRVKVNISMAKSLGGGYGNKKSPTKLVDSEKQEEKMQTPSRNKAGKRASSRNKNKTTPAL